MSNTTKPVTEERRLKEDESFFINTMLRQAGTLPKAGLEGIMNSMDSYYKCEVEPDLELPDDPRIEVTLTAKKLTIVDYGVGLRDRDEILEIWETFGTPHEENDLGEAQDTVFGKFRMGRGQLFAFGKNTWRTRTSQMVTDIKEWGRKYELTTGMGDQPGCVVEVDLYDALTLREIDDNVAQMTKMALYINRPLHINGHKVNIDPKTVKWDVETDDVYIQKRAYDNCYSRHSGSGMLEVYQQGVHVQSMPGWEFGVEGTVLSKCELQLNGARNEVMRNQCKRWRKIRTFLKKEGIRDVQRKKRLRAHEVENFVSEFSGGEEVSYDMFWETACLADVTGKLWSPKQIEQAIRTRSKNPKIHRDPDGNILVSFARRGDKEAEVVMQRKRAIVFDLRIIDQLRMDLEDDPRAATLDMIRGLNHAPSTGSRDPYDRLHGKLRLCSYKDLLGDDDNTDYVRDSPDDFTPRETDFLRCMGNAFWRFNQATRDWQNRKRLKLGIGNSSLAKGWTDGQTHITFSREFVSGLKLGIERDWHVAGLCMAELWCHVEDSTTADVADNVDYLQDFRRLAEIVPDAARYAYQTFRKIAAQKASKMPKQLKDQLHIEAETYAAEQLVYNSIEDTIGEEHVLKTGDEQAPGIDPRLN